MAVHKVMIETLKLLSAPFTAAFGGSVGAAVVVVVVGSSQLTVATHVETPGMSKQLSVHCCVSADRSSVLRQLAGIQSAIPLPI